MAVEYKLLKRLILSVLSQAAHPRNSSPSRLIVIVRAYQPFPGLSIIDSRGGDGDWR